MTWPPLDRLLSSEVAKPVPRAASVLRMSPVARRQRRCWRIRGCREIPRAWGNPL